MTFEPERTDELNEWELLDLRHQIFLQELAALLKQIERTTSDRQVLIVVKQIKALCENFR